MTDPIRLSKRLAELVGCSRREAELYIEGGWVSVDGNVVEEPHFKVTEQSVELHPDAEEVAEIFEVPLSFLLDPANHREQAIVYAGELRSFHAMPYQGYNIWGATAGMIVSLYQALSAQAQ